MVGSGRLALLDGFSGLCFFLLAVWHRLAGVYEKTMSVQKLMIQLGIRATPTFKFFYQGECIHTHTGIDEAKLRAAIETCQEKLRGPVAPAT